MARQRRILFLVFGVVVFVGISTIFLFRSNAFRLTLDDLRSKYATTGSQYVDIEDLSIHMRDEGSGSAVLLLHGSLGSLRTWDAMVNKLSDRFRFIRLDLPGYGLSSTAVPNNEMENVTLTSIIRELLARLNVNKLSIVGTSFGGSVGFWLASEYPEIVDRLILINTPSEPVSIPRSERPLPVRLQMLLCDDLLEMRTVAFWRAYYSYLWGDPGRIEQSLINKKYDMSRRVESYLPRHLVPRNPNPQETLNILGMVRAPTLIIWGMQDPVLPPSKLSRLEQGLKNTSKVTVKLPTVGHYPMSEVPHQVTQVVENFLLGS